MNWLHFIGKQYYTIHKFVKEAENIGINRKIAARILKKMNFGDLIFLAQGNSKGSKLFGFFEFTTLMGISPELKQRMLDEGVVKWVSTPNTMIKRGCGQYVLSSLYSVCDTKKLMVDIIREMDDEDLKGVMIGGSFHPLSDVGISRDIVNSNMVFRMGFREFDFNNFRIAYNEAVLKGSKKIRIIGYFYTNETSQFETCEVSEEEFFGVITDYQKK